MYGHVFIHNHSDTIIVITLFTWSVWIRRWNIILKWIPLFCQMSICSTVSFNQNLYYPVIDVCDICTLLITKRDMKYMYNVYCSIVGDCGGQHTKRTISYRKLCHRVAQYIVSWCVSDTTLPIRYQIILTRKNIT